MSMHWEKRKQNKTTKLLKIMSWYVNYNVKMNFKNSPGKKIMFWKSNNYMGKCS